MNPSLAVRKLHRWIALIFSISALMASGSGVLHNVMSRTQAPPPPARPGGGGIQVEQIHVPTQEALSKLPNPNTKIHAISIREIEGASWYQFLSEEGKPFYVNAESGAVNAQQDEIYAQQIASDYLGGKPVKKADYLTAFNQEYINIFRILPVYRFDAEDDRGTRVYVSTMTGSVTRYTDNQKQFEANVFTNFHKLGFIKNKDLRDLILTLTTGGIFLLSLLGIGLFFMTLPRKRN